MPSSPNQRLKLLYLRRILLQRTDEENTMSMPEIISALEEYDIKAERKAIYNDMELLRHYGIDIETRTGRVPRYYVASRYFELPELKLLVDAVQSSRFITEKKSNELIGKVAAFTSHPQTSALKRQTFVDGRPKAFNEQVFYTVNAIHDAINAGMKVKFRYFDYNVKKEPTFRKDNAFYAVTPLNLCWDSDKYYLVAYNTDHDEIRNYRVDRMSNAEVTDIKATDFNRDKFNIAEYVKQTFGMFRGEVVRTKLAFEESLVNVVIDYFGKEVSINPGQDGLFEISVDVAVSPVFLGWIFQFGGKVKILSPDSLVDAMHEMITANTAAHSKLSDTKDS